jgi:hypothetical protein
MMIFLPIEWSFATAAFVAFMTSSHCPSMFVPEECTIATFTPEQDRRARITCAYIAFISHITFGYFKAYMQSHCRRTAQSMIPTSSVSLDMLVPAPTGTRATSAQTHAACSLPHVNFAIPAMPVGSGKKHVSISTLVNPWMENQKLCKIEKLENLLDDIR